MLLGKLGLWRAAALVGLAYAATPESALAHVKWFCGPIDERLPPVALTTMLSPIFWPRAAAFIGLILVGSVADAAIVRRWPGREPRTHDHGRIEELLIRLGVGVYALALSAHLAVAPWGEASDGAILTPELIGAGWPIRIVQLIVGLAVVFRRTCPVAAVGVVVLYLAGVFRYGLFHMADYAYFLGLPAFLGLTSTRFARRPSMHRWRVPLLTLSLGFSLMWTGIEKFLYPLWTEIDLLAHPHVTFGFPIPVVTVTAGFIEFALASYLFVGRSMLRLGAVVLLMIFLIATPEFGLLDGVGHVPIIAILLVMLTHGPTWLQHMTFNRAHHPAVAGTITTGFLVTTFIAMTGMYYGLQRTTAWWPPAPAAPIASPSKARPSDARAGSGAPLSALPRGGRGAV